VKGFVQIADGLAIVEEIERIRRGERRDAAGHVSVEVSWRELSPWAIESDQVKIFPLARSDGSDEADAQLAELQRSLLMAFVHFFGGDGFHAESLLDPEEGYGQKLSRQRLASPLRYVWRVRDYAFTMVHAVDSHDSDASTLALHLYPAEWQWSRLGNDDTKRAASRRRRMAAQLHAATLDWAWPDAPNE